MNVQKYSKRSMELLMQANAILKSKKEKIEVKEFNEFLEKYYFLFTKDEANKKTFNQLIYEWEQTYKVDWNACLYLIGLTEFLLEKIKDKEIKELNANAISYYFIHLQNDDFFFNLAFGESFFEDTFKKAKKSIENDEKEFLN